MDCYGGLESNLLDARKKGSPIKEEIYIMSDVSEAYNKANEVISESQEAYNKSMLTFRATIKNDLSSISASANRVSGESTKMGKAYAETVHTLTSDDMERAIVNAERLAIALESISSIKPTDIGFKFLENK